ncbi:MAG: hypothetical protein KGZ80_08835 [Methylomonas sp.]|nr:hypothetical protein [Methylomonas sp.]
MATKKQILAQEVAKAVGAGKAVALETVDFNDTNRPKTCLEVDFPILPVNSIAHFKSHVALKALLEWLQKNGPDQTTRNAASRTVAILNTWQASQAPKPQQGSLFDDNRAYA